MHRVERLSAAGHMMEACFPISLTHLVSPLIAMTADHPFFESAFHVASSSPLLTVSVTFALQLFVAQLSCAIFDNGFPRNHHYHTYPEFKKNSIVTQIAMILPRIGIYWGISRLHLLAPQGYDLEYHSAMLDTACYIHACTYLFDATYRKIDAELLTHHFVSLLVHVYLQYLRNTTKNHVYITLLFVPFLVPGIVFGDTCIDISALTYSLAPRHAKSRYDVTSVTVLWTSATVHLLIRIFQWTLVLRYLWMYWDVLEQMAGDKVYALPFILTLWAKLEFMDAYVLYLFPGKLTKRRLQGEQSVVKM